MKKSVAFFVAMFVLVLAAACSSNEGAKQPSEQTVTAVKAQIESMQSMLPMEISPLFKLEKVTYDEPTHTAVYTYRFANSTPKPDDAALETAKKSAIAMLETDPNTKKMIEDGVNVQYNYYNPDGALSYSLAITYKDLEK